MELLLESRVVALEEELEAACKLTAVIMASNAKIRAKHRAEIAVLESHNEDELTHRIEKLEEALMLDSMEMDASNDEINELVAALEARDAGIAALNELLADQGAVIAAFKDAQPYRNRENN